MNRVSNIIRKKIETDNQFSNQLAIILGIKQQSVIALAKRNSDKLTLYYAVMFYLEQGFSLDQIFEKK